MYFQLLLVIIEDVEDEAFLEIVVHQPRTSSHTLLAELDLSQSGINQHLHKLSLVNRC